MTRVQPKKHAEKTAIPTPKKGPRTVTAPRGTAIASWTRYKDDYLSTSIPDGEICAARIREIDKNTFYCYRNGMYLGSAKTLAEAQKKTANREMSDVRERVLAWEKSNPGEVPPFLKLTESERAAYRHHNPPRSGAAAQRLGAAKPNEDPATRRLREQLALQGGKGARAAKKAAEASLTGVMVRLKEGNPKKPGSAPHERWALMFAHADRGSTVNQFITAKGNPTTLKNAIEAGWVRLEEKK